MGVAAPTGFGKSYWVNKLLEQQDKMIEPPPQRIIYLYKRWQPLFDKMQEYIANIEFVEGIPHKMVEADSALI